MQSHAFDDVLDLENQFYSDGFDQGLADGVKAGRVEGRTFGLEKGFEKYVESGKLHGKSLVWANQISQFRKAANKPNGVEHPPTTTSPLASNIDNVSLPLRLGSLPDNQRLAKNLKILHALVESESLSTENNEEAVSDFDDRLKRAQAKVKIIERTPGIAKGVVD